MPKTSSPKRLLLAGVCCGITAWLIYGVIELCCIAIFPWFLKAGYEYKAFDARFSALLLVLYAVLGAAVGAVLGVAVSWIPGWREQEPVQVLRPLNTAAIAGVLLLNTLILWRDWMFTPTILVVNLILVIAASLLATGSGDLARRSRPFSAAWLPCASYLVSLSLAGWPGVAATGRTFLYTTLWIAALWVAAWLAGRIAGAGPRIAPARALAGTAVLAIVCCAITAMLHATPYVASIAPIAPAAGRPNVILISLDTVRADHLSVYGYPEKTTPRLEEFAKESVVFTRAVSSGDMTLPSHASLFTGLYPSQHGAHFSPRHRMGVPLDARFDTLASLLRNQGYWTGGVVANGGYLSIAFGLNRGFTYWDQRLPAVMLAPLPRPYLRGRIRDLAVRFFPTSSWDRVSRSAEEINASVLVALDRRPRDGRPFFLFVNYMDAHIPYIPPAPYSNLFPGKDPAFTESRYIATYLDVISHNRPIGQRERAHLVSQYDGGIAYLDAQLAALFDHLKSAGLYENSLIVVTSDHGEALGERNELDHGGLSLYDDQIHVPLLIRYPGGTRRAVIDRPAAGVDILPTILQVAGAPVPKDIAGQSLAEPIAADREVLAESFPGGRAYFTNSGRFNRMYRGVMTASQKYIASTSGSPELYDLLRDPAESKNLYNPGAAQSREAAERLSAWGRAIAQTTHGPVNMRVPGKLDRETVERLRSLGYVSK